MCQGKTLSGKPCRANGDPYCRHHKPPAANLPLAHPKAIRKYLRGPSKTDGPGYIYVYYIDWDAPDTFYKIGRTGKTVKERLGQWKKSILKKSYYVKNQKLAESLIHLELDEIRVYRYTQEDGGYHTVWKRTGESVDAGKGTKVATKKHIEWFKTDWNSVKKKISTIINLVNDLPLL
jgi:hypothetical protein